ncbi:Uncharacterised protein [Legionella busanensis]|uniref:Uncharacterized protein n=1 Tax=Legionella busanensis TaxID=190655 RepID=A0A378JKF8_9GAMM|nr:hypothetical protein [Legionella busanensis]STX51567.1 Uncharacterised protein [Legionella busanensis]
MRFNLEEFNLKPKTFYAAILREIDSTNKIPFESKQPLLLLAAIVKTLYNIKEPRGEGSIIPTYQFEAFKKYLQESDDLIKKNLNIEVDNVLPYLIQAALYRKCCAVRIGNPRSIYNCVEDIKNNSFLLSETELVDFVPYAMDPEFRRMALSIMKKSKFVNPDGYNLTEFETFLKEVFKRAEMEEVPFVLTNKIAIEVKNSMDRTPKSRLSFFEQLKNVNLQENSIQEFRP